MKPFITGSIGVELKPLITGIGTGLEPHRKKIGAKYWHEHAAFQRSSFGRSRSGGRLQ